MDIYLVRHGDDDERYRGGWSELPLIDIGIEKCNKLAEYLERENENMKIEKIISSDLKRAKMTAEIINKKINKPIEYDSRIRENNNGIFAGMLNEEAIKNHKNAFFSNLEYEERLEGGESPKEFFERIKSAFANIVEENKEYKSILLVTHAGAISIIYHIINNLKWSNKDKTLKIPNTSISKIVYEDGKMSFEYFSDVPHLIEK